MFYTCVFFQCAGVRARTFVVHVLDGLPEREGDDARQPQALQDHLAPPKQVPRVTTKKAAS